MAAVLADGVTTIRNAAREPEITDLRKCSIKWALKLRFGHRYFSGDGC